MATGAARAPLKISTQERVGVLADCTRDEYERRLGRLREEMDRAGVDALLLTSETNVRYATALYELGWIIPAYFHAAVIPRAPELPPAVFVPDGDQVQAQGSWVETVVRWDFPVGFYTGRVGDSLVDALVGWLDRLGLGAGTIATELGAHARLGLSIEIFDALRARLLEARWRDCGDVVWPVRMIKSSEEIRRLSEAGRISCLGVRAGFEALQDGATERDIANVMAATMHEAGGGEIRFLSLYAGPHRALWADSIPRRESVLRPGGLLQFDGGCTYDGYFCDFKRMAALGEPTADRRRFFEIARAAEQAAIDAIAPGVPCGEVYEASQRVIRAAGYTEWVAACQAMGWSGIGHGLGLDIHEQPGLSIGNTTPLAAGMVLAVEPFFFHDGRFPLWEAEGKYGLEDVVLVTEGGAQLLTPDSLISRDLWVA
ncbi:MAG: aminopeptidase P family protein [Chloroflexi bacterium]|nr:aminopeptidase P family protein [Chloroflexota bacterium]